MRGQNCGPFLGILNIGGRVIPGPQKVPRSRKHALATKTVLKLRDPDDRELYASPV